MEKVKAAGGIDFKDEEMGLSDTLKNILLEFDDVSEKKDTYDRLLCYIWLDDVLINQVLIENGYGRYFDKYPFNSDRMKLFSKASKTAKEKKLGIYQ